MVAWKYEPVPGFFAQDDLHANPAAIGALPPRFGLLDNSPDGWEVLKQRLASLNENTHTGVKYKLCFLGRHGQGYHNLSMEKYGTILWNNYWAKLNTDGKLIWGPDPELTPKGIAEAQAVNKAWKREVSDGIPLPQKLYCSPLTRALHTCVTTFHDILPQSTGKTIVLENLREEYGRHTCDKRRTRTYIQSRFPDVLIEPGMTEDDEMWTTEREPHRDRIARAEKALDQMFSCDETIISATAHSGTINAILLAIGRDCYDLPTGGILPVVVKRTPRHEFV